MQPMAANADLTNPGSPSLWGLDRHLARFEKAFRDQPALVLVMGKPGAGKSSFVREAAVWAAKQGWRTTGSEDRAALQVGPDTTEGEFTRHVLELLGVPEAVPGEGLGLSAAGVRRAAPPPGLLPPGAPGTAATTGATKVLGGLSPNEPRREDIETPPPLQQSLAARLKALARPHAGILILIDGYRPAPEFAAWLAGVLLKDLTQAGAPVAVVVADEEANFPALQPLATEVISLDSLDRRELEQRFAAIGREIEPPMEAAELNCYIEEAVKRPRIIGPLRRVLPLARRGS
jgi:hypothetical protein